VVGFVEGLELEGLELEGLELEGLEPLCVVDCEISASSNVVPKLIREDIIVPPPREAVPREADPREDVAVALPREEPPLAAECGLFA